MAPLVPDEILLDEPLVEVGDLADDKVLRVEPRDGLDARDDVVHGEVADVLAHGLGLLGLPGDAQLGHEELDGAALDEDGEEDDDDGGEEEDVLERVLVGQNGDEGEADGAPQAPVGHDELLLEADPIHPLLVDQESECKHANEPSVDG